jgi:lysophospholipase L1-like esterase
MRTLKIVVFALILIGILFGISEVALRVLGVRPRVDNPFFMLVRVYEYPDYFKKDSHLIWRLRPNLKGDDAFLVEGNYRTNSLGLRGPEPALDHDRTVVACFGNSCTFGWRLSEDEAYPGKLNELLNAANKRYEVINCGVPGYSSYQGRVMLSEYYPILKPDIVTICYGWNDQWAAGFDIPDKDQKTPPQFVLDIQNVLSRSYTYRAIKYLLLSRSEKSREYTYNRKSPTYRVSLGDYGKNLEAMIDYCRRRGTKVILITAPIGDADPAEQNSMEEYHQLYNEVVRTLAKEDQVPLVDAARLFKGHPEFWDNPKEEFIHYNAAGAAMIARELARVIRTL